MTDDTLPAPPVPPEADLKDFPFTPMYRARLFGSSFHARANDAEWRAGVTLWLKSQDQVPAGSLPDDDVQLCRLAELGRDLKTWKKIRAMALHGWYLCTDGRLYNDVVAEIVNDQWQGRQAHADRKEKMREKKARQRAGHDHKSGGTDDDCPRGQTPMSPGTNADVPDVVPRENALKGQGEGQGKGQGLKTSQSAGVPADATAVQKPPGEPDRPTEPPTGPDWDAVVSEACRLAGLPPGREVNEERTRLTWIAEGLDPERDVLAAIRAAMAQPNPPDVGGLAYFTKSACRLRDIRLGRISAGPGKPAASPKPVEPDDFGTAAYWRRYVAAWDQRGRRGWGEVKHGPEPISRYTREYDPDCHVPVAVLAEFGIGPLAQPGAAA